MITLENNFISTLDSVKESIEKVLEEFYSIYKETGNEDLIESQIINLYEKLPDQKDYLKDILIATLKTTDINKEDKELLEKTIEEALWTTKLKQELVKSDIEKLLKTVAKTCKNTNVDNLKKT